MTAAEVLRAARAKIEMGWCQNTFARNAEGIRVLSTNPSACQWCAMGAVMAVCADSGAHDLAAEGRAFRALKQALGGDTAAIDHWNDEPGRTQEQVAAAFGTAIALAEAQP